MANNIRIQVERADGTHRTITLDELQALPAGAASAARQDELKAVLEEILAALGGSSSVELTDFTYDDFDGETLLTGYTANDVVWTIDRNDDGTIASVTHA